MTYDDLLHIGPYDLSAQDKRQIYTDMLSELTDHHRMQCRPYNRMCRLLGDQMHTKREEQAIPMLPVSLFKTLPLCSVPETEIFKTLTSSGTSGQQTSKIYLDRQTAAWQQMTLARIMSHYIGTKRIPMLIIDSPAVLKDRSSFSARGAGILGFSIFSSDRQYALREDMSLDLEGIMSFLAKHHNQPILLFGFTYMIWQYFCHCLKKLSITLPLAQGILIHGGGWKKLEAAAVSDQDFKTTLLELCGLKRIYNYYGMAEQTGCIYMTCEKGYFHASSYSDVLIRNMQDFSCCENGTEGVIEVLSPIAGSYPGHAILTEDQGIIIGEDDCPCGRKGKYFRLTGRIPQAEIRGCSDTYEKQ